MIFPCLSWRSCLNVRFGSVFIKTYACLTAVPLRLNISYNSLR